MYLKDTEPELTYEGVTYRRHIFYAEVPDAIKNKFQEHPHAGGVQSKPEPPRRAASQSSTAEGSD